MTFVHGSRQRMHAILCVLLALGLPVLGNRTAIAYLNTISNDGDLARSLLDTRIASRDTKPKPTRQQLRVSFDKGIPVRAAVRRVSARDGQSLLSPTGGSAPVRGQRSIAIARITGATPDYMKVYESPHSNLAPPG